MNHAFAEICETKQCLFTIESVQKIISKPDSDNTKKVSVKVFIDVTCFCMEAYIREFQRLYQIWLKYISSEETTWKDNKDTFKEI